MVFISSVVSGWADAVVRAGCVYALDVIAGDVICDRPSDTTLGLSIDTFIPVDTFGSAFGARSIPGFVPIVAGGARLKSNRIPLSGVAPLSQIVPSLVAATLV